MNINNSKNSSVRAVTTEDYRRWISSLIKRSNDIDYLIAVYSFADSYPDKTNRGFS